MKINKLVTVSFCAGMLLFAAGCGKLQSRDQMNKGIKAYKNNHYADAVKHFKEAVRLDPNNDNAESYLATSYMIQWVPGADSTENKRNYDAAKQEFDAILKRDPSNSLALASMASMAYQSATSGSPEQRSAALSDARKWNERRIEVDAKDAEAYYYLGVIDWAQAFPPSVMRVPRPSSRRKTPDQLRTLRFAKTSNPNIGTRSTTVSTIFRSVSTSIKKMMTPCHT